ncbi:hypothetical protein J3R82DRAFT_10426 [Butyriboletus roseoflavus]|nr:hypothetical protein J3R82DRAFT_10426 [Butyriboletus roseoflavus]
MADFGLVNCLQCNPPQDVLSPRVRARRMSFSPEVLPWQYAASDMDASLPFCNVPSPPGSKITSLRRCATVPAGSLYLEGPRINGTDGASPTAYSSSPSTPGLSYSPTPTESSLGDRTVQMATFMDVSTPPPGQFATFIGAQNDKVLATLPVSSNGLYVYTGSQDIALPSLPQRIDSQYFVSHGVVAPQ